MRIGIDARSLQNDSQFRGIGGYARSLINGLARIDKINEYVFFIYSNKTAPDLLLGRMRKINAKRKHCVWLSGQVLAPAMIKSERLDIFHSPEFFVPVLSGVRKVITVHDFINREYESYRRRNRILHRAFCCLACATYKYADKIIAVSEYTKERIIDSLGIDGKRIEVIYQAVDGIFRPFKDEVLFACLGEKYSLRSEFLLYAGAIDYHKNILGLLKAFSRIKDDEIVLVLAGIQNDARYLRIVHKFINELGLKDKVRLLGYIPQVDLAGLYNLAACVISVSHCEGFGLPILEGMSCARPVIASGNTSMREIVGPSGILVDPYNTGEITEALDQLLSNTVLRQSLAQKGFARAQEFSRELAASQTLSLYKSLAE